MCCSASGCINKPWCGVQEEVLSGKAKAQANVEELERLIPLLKEVRRACAAVVKYAVCLTSVSASKCQRPPWSRRIGRVSRSLSA